MELQEGTLSVEADDGSRAFDRKETNNSGLDMLFLLDGAAVA